LYQVLVEGHREPKVTCLRVHYVTVMWAWSVWDHMGVVYSAEQARDKIASNGVAHLK